MKKINCYSKYTYNVYLVISLMLSILAALPVILFKEDSQSIKLVWSCSMLLFSFVMIYAYFYHKQILQYTNNKLVLRNPFGVMQTLDTKNCIVEIMSLPTDFSWVGVSNKKWICIYDSTSHIEKFKTGVSNCKKHSRIQVIYNEVNESIIKKLLDRVNCN